MRKIGMNEEVEIARTLDDLTAERDELKAELNQANTTISATLAELVTRTNERDTLKEMLTDMTEERDMAEAELRDLRKRYDRDV